MCCIAALVYRRIPAPHTEGYVWTLYNASHSDESMLHFCSVTSSHRVQFHQIQSNMENKPGQPPTGKQTSSTDESKRTEVLTQQMFAKVAEYLQKELQGTLCKPYLVQVMLSDWSLCCYGYWCMQYHALTLRY